MLASACYIQNAGAGARTGVKRFTLDPQPSRILPAPTVGAQELTLTSCSADSPTARELHHPSSSSGHCDAAPRLDRCAGDGGLSLFHGSVGVAVRAVQLLSAAALEWL